MWKYLLRSALFFVCVAGTFWSPPSAARTAIFGPPPLPDAECKLAAVDPQHLFVAAGIMGGDTLANVQLGNPNSTNTIVRVEIASGAAPLTLFLQSDNAVIWDFAGAIRRVQRVVVVSPYVDRQIAVAGLPRERIEFPEFMRCPQGRMFPPAADTDEKRDSAFRFFFGRVPDKIVFQSHPNRLRLPAGEFVISPEGTPNVQRTDAESDLALYYRGGFRVIEAKTLISPVSVIEPAIYPGAAGLLQLERAGAIRQAVNSDLDARSPRLPSLDYVILQEIMIPPGLNGAHSKRFLVARGVPTPRGDPGHSCVDFVDDRPRIGIAC